MLNRIPERTRVRRNKSQIEIQKPETKKIIYVRTKNNVRNERNHPGQS